MVRKGPRVRGVVVAALVLGGFLGAGSPARATAPGVEFTGLYADNNEHFFFHHDLEDVTEDALEWARKYALDPPSALVTEKDDFYGVQTDVVSYDDDYTGANAPPGMEAPCWDTCPRNTLATTWCTSTDGVNAADKCQQFQIYFDLPDVQGFNVAQRNWLACHELGHTVGFDDPVDGGPAGRHVVHEVLRHGPGEPGHALRRPRPKPHDRPLRVAADGWRWLLPNPSPELPIFVQHRQRRDGTGGPRRARVRSRRFRDGHPGVRVREENA